MQACEGYKVTQGAFGTTGPQSMTNSDWFGILISGRKCQQRTTISSRTQVHNMKNIFPSEKAEGLKRRRVNVPSGDSPCKNRGLLVRYLCLQPDPLSMGGCGGSVRARPRNFSDGRRQGESWCSVETALPRHRRQCGRGTAATRGGLSRRQPRGTARLR